MDSENIQPIAEEEETTAEEYLDPYGPDPEAIPDPMPDDLQAGASTDETTAMEDEAPTG